MKKNSHQFVLSKSEIESRKNKTISFLVLFVICFVWLVPFLVMVGTSLKTTEDIILNPIHLFPSKGEWTLQHYSGFIKTNNGTLDNLPLWMINSTVTTLLHVLINIVITTIAAYAFVFLKFKGKKFIVTLIVASLTIPAVISFTPMYSMYVSLGQKFSISDNIFYVFSWLVLPGVAGAFNLIIIKNFFESIPIDVIESARSDGAKELTIFRRVVLPLARSSILVCGLFSFTGCWNNLLFPQLILSSKDSTFQTITVALIGYTSNQSIEFKGLAMATCVFSLLPILIVFLITQNKMIDGLASTGVKR